jgi:opacity protein-like surface antigen
MNCKEFQPKVALALAMIGFAEMGSFSLPARGADYERPFPPPAPAYDMVEFASGWYVRGDIAYAQETFPNIQPTFGSTPSVLNTYRTGAGMGYKVNDWFRTDLVLDYRSPVQANGVGATRTCITGMALDPNPGSPTFKLPIVTATDTCTGHFATDIHRWDLLANGYIDLVSWQGFTPYVGAGAGVAWAQIKQSANWFMSNGLPYMASFTLADGENFFFDFDRSKRTLTYHFAWALMAGMAVAVAEHVQLDVGYRFLNLGSFSTLSSVTGISTTQRFIANEVRGGLRYTLD